MGASETPFPHLFSPLQLAGHKLRNRVALPATLTNYGRQSRITPRWAQFLIERAKGGAGLIISEVIAVDPNAVANQAVVTGYEAENEDGFRHVAAEVTAAGGVLVGQLWHPGRQQLWHPTKSPMGVSDQPDAYSWTVAHVMSEADIAGVVEAYVNVALRLQRCGFAGVELHGAHGYLIGQFLSPWSNQRDDAYGGDLPRRAAFCLQIANGIRLTAGSDFIVGLKMPGTELVKGGIDPEEAERITRYLAGNGPFDYMAYGQGNFSLSLESHVPDLYFRPGHFLAIHRRMRAAAGGVPVLALGRIPDPALADQAIREETADLVGLCRAQIADAAFANKARQGAVESIRPSLFDNWCWGEVHKGKPLAEAHNPHLAETGEAEWQPVPSRSPLKLAVIGAGLAGVETAWRAAAAGHQVTLYGASSLIGGRYRLEAELPGRSSLILYLDYLQRLLQHHGVDLKLGSRANVAAILAQHPDAVVLATGALPRPPEIEESDNSVPMASIVEYVARSMDLSNQTGTVLLFDQDHGPGVYGVADLLASQYEKLILMTPRPQIADNVNYCSAIGVYRRLYGAAVEIRVAETIHRIEKGVVSARNMYSDTVRSVGAVGAILYATPPRVCDAFEQELMAAAPHLPRYAVGDCQSPRDKRAAVHGADALVSALG